MTSDVDQLLTRFFGTGNELDLGSLKATSPDLAAWLNDRIIDLRTEPTGTHVLPRRSSGRTIWYALAHSPRQARALAQELQAFVGDSYAQVEHRQPLDPSDEIEAAVLEFTDGHAFSFDVVPARQAAVRASLDILASLRRARPLRSESTPRPLGRLLRDFEMAVVAGDEHLSAAALDAIEQSGFLSTQNVLFLRVRQLAALRRFGEILSLPELGPLMSITRPGRVTADLLRAVYSTELEAFEATNDARGALEHFEGNVLRRFPALFKSRHGVVTPEAVKIFALHLVASGPYDPESLEELYDSPDLTETDRTWVNALGRLGATVDHEGGRRAGAIELIRLGRFEEGLRAASRMAATLEQAELVLRCAFEIDSLEALQAAFEVVVALDEEDRETITTSRWLSSAWDHVQATVGAPSGDAARTPTPTSWSDLFEQIVSGVTLSPIALAERGVVEWSIDSMSESEITRISSAISAADSEVLRAVSDTLPHFMQFLDRAEDQRPYRPLLDDIALLLLSEDTLRTADLHVLVGMLSTLLDLGVDSTRYADLIQDFLALWRRTDAPSHLDALLELLDALVLAPAPDPNARLLLLQAVLASFQRWRRRVRIDQWRLLDDLADELGVPEATAAIRSEDDPTEIEHQDDLQHALAGQTVAIYSLTEPAAQRAEAFLTRHFRDVRVELTHDHVASDRLRSLATSADVFVIATRSAKHAATTFIQANRPSSLPTLFPAGKGSASIIRSIYSFVLGVAR